MASTMTNLDRRGFLKTAVGAALCGKTLHAANIPAESDFTLRISKVTVELAPGKTVKTTGYNGSAPGPLLRLKEGRQVTIQVINETDHPNIVHWHGLQIPSNVDGAMEEGTPMVDAHGSRLYTFTPKPSGTRWYHTHMKAGRDLDRATYSGEFGFLYIDPPSEPGAYDQEHFLAFKEWDAYLSTSMGSDSSMNAAYKYFSINGSALGHGEPIKVKQGERVMLRMLNASATNLRRVAISGHRFQVVAMDGNTLPNPVITDVLEMGPAERIDAIVKMNRPGVWALGATNDHDREQGMGIVVEYAGQTGAPQWLPASDSVWDYRIFGNARSTPNSNARRIPLVFQKKWAGNNWVDFWMINGKSYPKTDPIRVQANQTYRLIFDNKSDEAHPVHLHRHTFELVKVEGTATSGVLKDVVMVGARKQVEVEFKANNPGPTLFHCHQQMHMDFGFMALLQYS